jgi:coenzyme F420-reducing hydrogenase delta subunit/Pyruvate/2-oxoacid:ferredoxin oxidoreductase delta subunit
LKVEILPIRLDEERCSKCLICYSVCPFKAILLHQQGMPSIDLEKCTLCGICAAACPSDAIKLYYYDYHWLVREASRGGNETIPKEENLVVMCRGSSPPGCDVSNILKDQKLERASFLRVPCVGRLPAEFYLKLLSLGMKRIIVVQCSEEFCRFSEGSSTSRRRIEMLKTLLKYFGYEDDVLQLLENPQQLEYDTSKCVGCDKCVYICPYAAIEAAPLGTPKIDYEKCKGCGACALACPHLAMQVKGFKFERLSHLIQSYADDVKSLKSQGIAPVILVFCCQWAEFPALDTTLDGFLRKNVALVEIPCFNRLDPINVVQAFRSGFDGVLAVVCLDGDCKSGEGRQTAEENMAALTTTLNRLGIQNRFEVYKTSPRNIGGFESKVDSFVAKVAALPKSNTSYE